MSDLLRDLRHAARTLVRTPAYTVVAIATLALGIGVNTAVFSTVNAVLLRPLPFPQPDRLVRVWSVDEGQRGTVSPPDFTDWRSQARTFERIAAYVNTSAAAAGEGGAEHVPGARVTGGFFELMGAAPVLGRGIVEANERPGDDLVVVLSHGLWQRRYGGDAGAIGQTIRLDGEAHEIVGVAPRGFSYPQGAEYWKPQSFTENDLTTQRGAHYLQVVARLAPGSSLAAAGAEMRRIAAVLEAEYPRYNTGMQADVQPLRDAIVGDVRPALQVLLGAVALVLLIACVNVANLSLARSLARQREAAIRTALGASRGRLIRESLLESLLVGALGGCAGMVLGWWTADVLWGLDVVRLPRLEGASLDLPVLAFTLGATVLTVLGFGLVPALRTGREPDVGAVLKEGGRTVGGRAERLRSGLVVAEIALAVVLLAGAGLLLRSFAALQDVDLGFRPERLLTFEVDLPEIRYQQPADARRFFQQLTADLGGLPGVEAIGASSNLPLSGNSFFISVELLDGEPAYDDPGDEQYVQLRIVTPDYFRATGIALRGGRAFTPQDRDGAPLAVLVNEAAARLFWPGRDPVGHTIEVGTRMGLGGDRVGGRVIGVVADTKEYGPAEPERPMLFAAHAQFPVSSLAYAVRTESEPTALVNAARTQLRALDREIPMARVRTGDDLAAGMVARARLYTVLLLAFAGLALGLAVLGIYGLIAYVVAQRSRELGVRMALGARGGDVLRLVLRRAAGLAGAGLFIGLIASLAATRTLESLLFGVTATDPVTLLGVCTVLCAVALAASYVPARRATRVDPAIVLRQE